MAGSTSNVSLEVGTGILYTVPVDGSKPVALGYVSGVEIEVERPLPRFETVHPAHSVSFQERAVFPGCVHGVRRIVGCDRCRLAKRATLLGGIE